MENPAFMNVKQVAEYIHLNEKKVYALISEGELPATKVTGKWMFPRELIDRWLLDSTHGGLLNDRLLIVGSDDPLLYRAALRMSHDMGVHATIIYNPTGTRHGLEQMQARRADVAVMRWGPDIESRMRHPALLQQYSRHKEWVLVHAFRREQGLMITPPVARQSKELRELFNPRNRWVMRQHGSGGQRFLLEVLAQHGLSSSDMGGDVEALSEREAAASISMDLADVAPGSRGTAVEFGLEFISLGWESVDMALPKNIWFRHLFQALLKQIKAPETVRSADEFEGYDLTSSGEFRWSQG